MPRLAPLPPLLVLAAAAAAVAQEPAPESLFDGRTLRGWDGEQGVWSVRDGCIVGSTVAAPIASNTFLVWQGGEPADFELTFAVRLEGDNNSGMQYRSRLLPGGGHRVAGYQCDVHQEPRYFGMLYEEGGRGIVATRGQQVVCGADGKPRVVGDAGQPPPVDLAQWHRFRIVARGRTVQHWVDGALAVEVQDDAAKARQGVLALQMHAGPPMTVWFKDLVLRRLPAQAAPAGAAAAPQAAPQWIWDASPQDGEEVFFRRTLTLPGVPKAATLAVTADNHCRVFVNGERVVQGDAWEAPVVADVGGRLRQGENVIAVHAWNDGGPAGLCAQLSWTLADGHGGVLVTDQAWRCSGDDPDGWDGPGFDDRGFQPATALAPLGGGPWAAVLAADAFADAVPDLGPQPPAAAGELRLPPGFRARRLLRVPRSMGSWVCLAADPSGRLYASDQTRGLYRIAPAGLGGAAATAIERVEVDLDGCQGLCWAFGALYAVVNVGHPGLYRLTDSDGDDRLDHVELLRALAGSGEHGPHAVVPAPDGRNLLVVGGNHTPLPELARSRLPRNWADDNLLPKFEDPNGHAVGIPPPGGWICLVDPGGREWELYCAGLRNAYDLAVLPDGDLVTFDADMEWDMGLPWYRPTRILQVVSGADYGWRRGSGKWPADYPDTLPAVADVGPSSPTGMLWTARGLFALDWTFGTIYEVALQPDGAGWRGAARPFATGEPWPLTDAVAGAGGLYVLTGGRGIPSRLYHLERDPDAAAAPPAPFDPAPGAEARSLRLLLEDFHGRVDPAALGLAWPQLGSRDPFVRHAARIAVESQPVATWRARALAEGARAPWAALTAWLALARQGEATDLEPLLAALARLPFAGLDRLQRIAWLRVHELLLLRLAPVPEPARAALAARLLPLFPCGDERLDQQLCALLAALDAPGLLDKAVPLLAPMRPAAPPPWLEVSRRNASYGGAIQQMLAAMPPSAQLGLANALRTVRNGWTLAQRQAFFAFLLAARGQKGGASYGGYVRAILDAAYATCSPAEQAALAELVGRARKDPAPFRATPPHGPGRDWQLAEAVAIARAGLHDRDFAAGRNLFHACSCASCHYFAGEGGSVGPDLTSLGNKFTAADVLEAILEPSKVVSDQYAGSVLKRRDGSTLFGRVVRTVADGVDVYEVVTATAEVVRVPAAAVAAVEPSKLSPMPADLVDRLAEPELLDLVAFLLSRGAAAGPMFAR